MDIRTPNENRQFYMRLAVELAEQSPPKPSNFKVGAVLVDEDQNQILSTGYTLELPGNTHAEQCCLQKYAEVHDKMESDAGNFLPDFAVLYTTMEPCGVRLSGNMPCVERIIQLKQGKNGGIRKVYHGVKEPETFVGENKGRLKLEAAGVEFILVPGFEEDILRIATAGHQQEA